MGVDFKNYTNSTHEFATKFKPLLWSRAVCYDMLAIHQWNLEETVSFVQLQSVHWFYPEAQQTDKKVL